MAYTVEPREHSKNTTLPTVALPPSPPSSFSASFGPFRYDTKEVNFDHWTSTKEKVVTGPYDYIAAKPGKEVRTLLLACFDEWLQVPPESLEVIGQVVRMLHTASLLIDDIQDNSELRRGKPVAQNIFGTALTINSANYVYFLALEKLNSLKNPNITDVFTEELLRLHRGQAMDLYWRDTLTCPTEEEYFEMVANKTGGLFRLMYRMMKAESSMPIDLLPVVELLGVIFQVVDDYKNLCSREYGKLKGFGEDLTEGKFSFPVIHSIRSNPEDLQLLHVLQQKSSNEHVKLYAIQIMESTGSLEYTKHVVENMVSQIQEIIYSTDEGQGRGKGILDLLHKITRLS